MAQSGYRMANLMAGRGGIYPVDGPRTPLAFCFQKLSTSPAFILRKLRCIITKLSTESSHGPPCCALQPTTIGRTMLDEVALILLRP